MLQAKNAYGGTGHDDGAQRVVIVQCGGDSEGEREAAEFVAAELSAAGVEPTLLERWEIDPATLKRLVKELDHDQ